MLLDIAVLAALMQLVGMNLLAPLLILHKQRLPARIHFGLLAEEEFLPLRNDYFRQLDAELKRLGFVYGGSSLLENASTQSYFSLYQLPGDPAGAMLVTISAPGRSVTYIEFCQRFTDDTVLDVNNADMVSAYPALPRKIVLRYPDVNEPAALLANFKRIRARLQKTRSVVAWDADKAFAVLETAMARESDELVRLGFCRQPVDGEGRRRLTLKGAYRMTWKNVFPGKLIQKLLDMYRAQRMLQQG